MGRYLIFFVYLFLSFRSVIAIDPEQLRQSLQKKLGYSILTVGRDFIKDDTYTLSIDDLSIVLKKIHEITFSIQKPMFVVFNEYFCSRLTLEYDRMVELRQQIISHSLTHPFNIYYINFLYKLEPNTINSTQLEELKSYLDSADDILIEDNTTRKTWPIGIQCSYGDSIIHDDPNKMFANETFVVINGEVISKYRKSTYCHENDTLVAEGWSYYCGFGKDIPQKNNKLAQVIHQNVYTDICLDVHTKIREWTYRISRYNLVETVSQHFARSEKAFAKLSILYDIINKQELINPSLFHLHIIQSNSIYLDDIIGFFPDNQIVIQSDPSASLVILIKKPDYIEKFAQQRGNQDYVTRQNSLAMCYLYRYELIDTASINIDEFLTLTFTFFIYNIGE